MSVRLSMIAACLLLIGMTIHAAPSCALVKARPDAWVATKVDALVVAARAAFANDDALPAYERALDEINASLRQCQLSKDESFVSRYRPFVEYVEAASLDRQPDHELGFVVPDKQYFAETRQFVQVPDFLTEKGFLRAVSRYETLGQAKSYLRRLNSMRDPSAQLIFFSYKSQHLGTPDNDDSYRRLLIVVPGDAAKGLPEKWVQFGITDPGARVHIRNLSVVSALASADGTSNVYFKDYYRTYRPDGSITINGRWESGYGDDNCVQCHKSGVLPIFPEAGSVSRDEQQAVQAVNERFLTYGSPRFGKYLDETKFGPGLGSASLDDRRRRFGAGFDESAAGRAMTCNACHRPERLGALDWPMDQVVISSYIKGGQMPFGSNLKLSERNELYDKLIREYFATDAANPGILKSWLLGRLQ
ncbi:MAG: hypothetical protein QOE33_1783 [Acidobacteriota bacterium]|nr:hypothetical protein [Acidobacteriota bacterium]